MPVHDGPIHDGFDKWYMHYWTRVREIAFYADRDRVQLLDTDGNHIMTIDGIDRIGPNLPNRKRGDTLEIRDFFFDSEHSFMSMRFASDVEIMFDPTNEYKETRILVCKQGYLSTCYKSINIEE